MNSHVFLLTLTIPGIALAALLRKGSPLWWSEAVSSGALSHVRRSGPLQFAYHYKRSQPIETPSFLWGDEIEYGVFGRDARSGHLDLSLRSADIIEELSARERLPGVNDTKAGCEWQPEYGAWMVEAVPRFPYTGYVSELFEVEKSMALRRKRLHSALAPGEVAPSITVFPMLGVEGYAHTEDAGGDIAASACVSDRVVNGNPRFLALTKNIRTRRGSNVNITLPLEDDAANTDKTVHMDAMAFGMGCCCLQITMQSQCERQSRFLHDQLTVLAPLFMALSASTPIARGRLLDTDTRWDVISQAVDDRTPAERGQQAPEEEGEGRSKQEMSQLAGGGVRRLLKSRYSSVSRFIGKPASAEEEAAMRAYNDVEAGEDEETLGALRAAGLDEQLARHLAHMFVRDPLVIFNDTVHLDDTRSLDHFENIQSTNWRTIRWKPPVLEAADTLASRLAGGLSAARSNELSYAAPGWRVEFRPLEVQLTDFENAAWAIMVVLASRCVLAMGYNLYLPMSLVEENMRRASLRDAVKKQTFFVRRSALSPTPAQAAAGSIPSMGRDDVLELTLNEFINGQGQAEGFPGLVPAVLGYLESVGCSPLVVGRLMPYLNLIQQRASGELPTAAQWMRRFVRTHPDYRADGRLTPAIADDLMRTCDDIGMGRVNCTELHGTAFIRPLYCDDPYDEDAYNPAALPGCVCISPSSYRPKSFCSGAGGGVSVLFGSGPEPDAYLETLVS